MARSLRVRCYPASDEAFARVAQAAAAGASSPGELAARLRPAYPRVAVSERCLSGEPALAYVYRDGGFLSTDGERWWAEPDAAVARVSAETGRLVAADERWAQAVGVRPDELIGRHFTDFVLDGAQPAAHELFATVVEGREIRTEILVRRGDGTSVLLDVRAIRDGDIIDVACRRSPHERRHAYRTSGQPG